MSYSDLIPVSINVYIKLIIENEKFTPNGFEPIQLSLLSS